MARIFQRASLLAISLAYSICTYAVEDVSVILGGSNNMDVTAGQQLYAQCSGCHSPAWHRTGPMHCNLIGRQAGRIEGFSFFTPAMKNSTTIWTSVTLDAFLRAPLEVIPGTSMTFSGIKSVKERKQLIAYLATLTAANPLCR